MEKGHQWDMCLHKCQPELFPSTLSSTHESPQSPPLPTTWKMLQFHMYNCSKSIYIHLCTYVFIFMSSYVFYHSRCVPLCVLAAILFICLPVNLIIHLNWEFWLWQGKPCGFCDYNYAGYNGKINQTNADMSACLTFSLYLWKICISHYNSIMSHTPPGGNRG